MLIYKFPGCVRERWNRKVLFIRRTHKRDPKLFDLLRFVEEESMLVNDPLFSTEGVKFFAETGSGGRRIETSPGSRREKNFKKGKHSAIPMLQELQKKKIGKKLVVTFVKERISWMTVRKLSRKQLKKEVN